MSRKLLKFFSLPIVLVLTLIILTGCGAKGQKTSISDQGNGVETSTSEQEGEKKLETITLTFFDKNIGEPFDDPVAQEITRRTGVKLEIQQPTGNPDEKLNLILASGDLPDMVMMSRTSDTLKKYIAANALIPLNDLIENYGPDVKTQYGDVLNKSRYTDGKNYFLNSWYGLDPDPVYGMLMRMDILKEIAGEKATTGEPFTLTEFEEILNAFKQKYPKLNGHDTIPLSLNGEQIGGVLATFKGFWGMMPYYEDNGTLKYDLRDPRYLEMLKYLNSLYRQGLIDKEWAIVKNQLWEQKLSNGYVLATTGAWWQPSGVNGILKKAANGNAESQFYAYKLVAPGASPDKITLGGRSPLGWDAIGITKENKYPERTMQFFNFLASDEGQYLMLWGLEGTHWNITGGKKTPDENLIQKFKEDWAGTMKKTGVRKWLWFIKNGFGPDGTPYDMVVKWKRSETEEFACYKSLKDTVFDNSPYENLGPSGGTSESMIAQKIRDITEIALPKIINAKSEEEVVNLYNKMISDIDKAGAAKIEQIINENYQKKMELWK